MPESGHHGAFPSAGNYRSCLLSLVFVLSSGAPGFVSGQFTSTCDRALAEAYLDANKVRARIVNTGGLFWRGEPHVYEVPKGSGSNAIFTSNIMIAGRVGGQLRASSTRYGEWEMWAGPLDDNGNPPADCSVFDRVYKVDRQDIEAYESNGLTTPDLVDWPTGLGAPTYDVHGNLIDLIDQPLISRVDRSINLEAGERPAIMGDQSIWWVMNDRGNQHTSSGSPAIGLEVHAMAYAFSAGGDLGTTTFYRFSFFYKGQTPFEDVYFAMFSDPDLGDFSDDYVGSDSLLGMGYVYNADNLDEGPEGYGARPPAVGYDFVQGPVVPSRGDTAYVRGEAIPDFKTLKMTSFSFLPFGGGSPSPYSAPNIYLLMQGLRLDGRPFIASGDGRNCIGRGCSFSTTRFMYSGDPAVQGFWTEADTDGLGRHNSPGDRNFLMSTGPFTMNPGDLQEITLSIVYGRGSDNWDSVQALRDADRVAQAAFDAGFKKPPAPDSPVVIATPFDSGVTLSWTNEAGSNNYLESYMQNDVFARFSDQDYVFEGYRVIEFSGENDHVGDVIATYDVANGVTRVVDVLDNRAEPPLDQIMFQSAEGSDSGIFHSHTISGLTNLTEHYFGVQAYAYNAASVPRIFASAVTRIKVLPRRSEDIYSERAVQAALDHTLPDFVAVADAVGQGVVSADIAIPGLVIENATYTTRFYEVEAGTRFVTYDIDRTVLGERKTMFDGSSLGRAAPVRENVILIDGLQFSITHPAPGMVGFSIVANGGGPLDPPDMAAFANVDGHEWGFPRVEGRDYPEAGRNQFFNHSTWGIHVGLGSGPYGDEAGPFNQGTTWVGRSIREGSEENPWPNIGSDDFEWRFTRRCFDGIDGAITEGECVAWRGFEDGALVEIPFEVWNTGVTSDAADDYRMLPLICESVCTNSQGNGSFNISGDHPVSDGDDDPFSDWIYWYKPEDNGAAPGDAGYHAWFFGDGGLGDRTFSRQVLVNWNGGSAPPYNADMVEPGTVIRYETNKPSQPGDTFTFNTTGYGTKPPDDALKKSRLADINVVPNPYLLTSAYERNTGTDEVRFSNLPLSDRATLRIYTLSGTLISTLEKPVGTSHLAWDLTTETGLPIGSGIYLIHVEVDGIGSQVIKFAAVKKVVVSATN